MKVLLTVSAILLASIAFAQKHNIYFLQNNGSYVDFKDSADYIRIVSEPDSGTILYNVSDYYKNGIKKAIAKSSAIYPVVFQQRRITYYKTGVRQSIVNYENGHAVGDYYEYFPNGKIYSVKTYPDEFDGRSDWINNYDIKENYDSVGTTLVINANGQFKGYAGDLADIYEEGLIKNGKRDGLWKGNSKEYKATFTENYDNGKLITGNSVFEDGQTFNYTGAREIDPQFKGGLNAFAQFLGKNIRYPSDAVDNKIQGRVLVSFTVENNGKITGVTLVRTVCKSIDAEALRVMAISPAWIPANIFGRDIKRKLIEPIGFALSY